MTDFDPTPYVHAPTVDAPGALALAHALLSATPKGATPEVKRATAKLKSSVAALADVTTATPADKPNRRAADSAIDNAWGATHGRLVAYARLPESEYPKAARAQELVDRLFPDGLAFLQLPHKSEWTESDKRLRVIKDEKLRADVDALVGKEFLAEVERTHAIYGEVLGITKAAGETSDVRVLEPLRAVRRAIADYALKVAAMADLEDAASVKLVKAALKPIDDQRVETASRKRGGGAAKVAADGSKGAPGAPTTPTAPTK